MNLLLTDTPFAALVWFAVKVTTIVAAAALLQALWRRRTSAATRHLAWTLVATSLLLLPIAWRVAPRWSVAAAAPAADETTTWTGDPTVGDAPATVAAATMADVESPATPRQATAAAARPVSAWMVALGIHIVGLAGVLLSLALHHWRTGRLAARATEVIDGPWAEMLAAASTELGLRRPVRLLCSREVVLPMTFGTRVPAIVIPATADLWSDDRRRAVLLHELAHVARYDCLTQTLALLACAAYWPHPGVWWVARQLRVERELACDDRVLAAGAEAQAYAGHLLDIAYSLDGRRAPALALSMARPSQLEGRLLAALDGARNRRSPGPGLQLALGAAASMAVVVLAGATPIAREIPVGGGPVVVDQSAPPDSAAPVSAAVQDNFPGTWEIRPTTTPGMVHLRLAEGRNTHGTNVPLALLVGLTEAQLAGAGGPVTFRITRDAGTLQFEGVVRSGVAAGTFSFTPNAAFPAELVKRGFTRPTAREQYELARFDVGYAFLDELTRLGYAKPDTAGLVTAGQHGVDVTYLREMGALGYALGSLPALITLRDHGVTPDYARGMAQEGYAKLPADTLRQARDHGVGPEYVKGMREAGYTGLTLEALISARDHGVTSDYIGEMRQLGYTVPVDALVRARDHGVTPAYARELKALGYDSVTLDDLVLLRDHGVTPDRVRSANARAGTRLPVDLLRSLADGGGLR